MSKEPKVDSDTLIWITGATEGIGLALARTAPFPDARIVNLSRRPHPDYESVAFDLTRPETWDGVRRHVHATLATFRGKRALFIQNAYYSEAVGLIGKVAYDLYEKSVVGNVAAPLVLAEAFVTACRPGYESGLVLMSSGAAVAPLEGLASYCAAKVAIEHWAEVVGRERESQGLGPWIVAVRPGGVETAPVRATAAMDPSVYPRAAQIKANIPNRLTPEQAARRIWAALPPPAGVSVISFAPAPSEPAFRFGGREQVLDAEGWKLVYATGGADTSR
jgi:short-subunit dehydrogenase